MSIEVSKAGVLLILTVNALQFGVVNVVSVLDEEALDCQQANSHIVQRHVALVDSAEDEPKPVDQRLLV